MPTRRFEVTFQNPGEPLDAAIVVDDQLRGSCASRSRRLGLQVVREDASSVAMRAQTARNPTDADVSIPANGFNLAGTLTMPPTSPAGCAIPAVVLVGGPSPADRDESSTACPCSRSLPRRSPTAAADRVRYDRRGGGQSGGRTETATLADYADDVERRRAVAVEARRRGQAAASSSPDAAKAGRWR